MPDSKSAAARVVSRLRNAGQVAQSDALRTPERQILAGPVADAIGALRSGPSVRSRNICEPLEGRQFFSVAMENGWTVVTPASDTRVVYVSVSQGSDANSGLSASSPLKSIAKAKTLLRDGAGDQLLLKKNDVFSESLGYWRISGKSADQPLLIGSYGEGARPEIRNTSSYAFGAGSPTVRVHDIMVQGIRMYAAHRDPSSTSYNGGSKADGIYLAGNIQNMTFEDVSVEFYNNNIVAQAYYANFDNLQIRKSTVANSWSPHDVSHSQGAYIEGVNGVLLEGNTFDHNGWNGTAPKSEPTNYNHNAYIQALTKNLVARNNTFANASSHGMQARPGGVVEDNLFLNNPIGLTYGLVNGSGPVYVGGVSGVVRANVFVGGRDIAGQPRGVGMEVANTAKGANVTIEKNIFTKTYDGGIFAAINLSVGNNQNNPQEAVGLNDLTLKDNIVYKWERGVWVNPAMGVGGSGPYSVTNLNISNNDFQEIQLSNILYHGIPIVRGNETIGGNRYHTQNPVGAPFFMDGKGFNMASWFGTIESTGQGVKANYVDPERDIKTYSFTQGGAGTEADFLTKAKLNTKANYNAAYSAVVVNAYIRAGFVDRGDGTPAIPGGYVPPVSELPPSIPTPPVSNVPPTTPPPPPGTEVPPVVPPTVPPPPPAVEPTPPPASPPPAPNPTPDLPPTNSGGYQTVVGPDGKVTVIWVGTPTVPPPPTTAPDPAPPAPEVVYVQPALPTIQYEGGYWYVS